MKLAGEPPTLRVPLAQPSPIDVDVLTRLMSLARRSSEPIARMSMDQIARELGMTRMTLYRRAGSRRNIVEALEREGIDVQSEPMVRERVIDATAELLRERPIATITLELIAEHARCSLPAIHDIFDGRQGVFSAMFERHTPLRQIEQTVAGIVSVPDRDLEDDARALYAALFDAMEQGWPLLRAFVGEVLRDPDSEIGQLFREWYGPRVMRAMLPVLVRHIEHSTMRDLPAPLIAHAFAGPMLLHMATRGSLASMLGNNLPDRQATIDAFTATFVRAVGQTSAPEAGARG